MVFVGVGDAQHSSYSSKWGCLSLVAEPHMPASAVELLQAVVASANAMHRTMLAPHV